MESERHRCYVGKNVRENRSQTISEGTLLQLTAADHERVLGDGTGLSGKVHVGSKRISVHFRYRYRYRGDLREMPLGAWPRDRLADIRLRLESLRRLQPWHVGQGITRP